MYRISCIILFVILFISRVALAGTNVNTADEAALQAIGGIGASKASAIVADRTEHGPFKDADDLAARVKGLGEKSVKRLQQHGLEIVAPPSGKSVHQTAAAKPRRTQQAKAANAANAGKTGNASAASPGK